MKHISLKPKILKRDVAYGIRMSYHNFAYAFCNNLSNFCTKTQNRPQQWLNAGNIQFWKFKMVDGFAAFAPKRYGHRCDTIYCQGWENLYPCLQMGKWTPHLILLTTRSAVWPNWLICVKQSTDRKEKTTRMLHRRPETGMLVVLMGFNGRSSSVRGAGLCLRWSCFRNSWPLSVAAVGLKQSSLLAPTYSGLKLTNCDILHMSKSAWRYSQLLCRVH